MENHFPSAAGDRLRSTGAKQRPGKVYPASLNVRRSSATRVPIIMRSHVPGSSPARFIICSSIGASVRPYVAVR